MFGLFNKKDNEVSEKPLAADVAAASESKRRPGRILSEEALRTHDAVVEVLTDVPQTRSAVIAKLPESLQAYANGNWQNIMLRLLAQNKAKLAEGSSNRGRGVAYTRA